MNAYIKCYGDTIVNSYREADHQVDKMIDALQNFVKEPEFHQEYKEQLEWGILCAKKASYALNTMSSLIIELEGSNYGD